MREKEERKRYLESKRRESRRDLEKRKNEYVIREMSYERGKVKVSEKDKEIIDKYKEAKENIEEQ